MAGEIEVKWGTMRAIVLRRDWWVPSREGNEIEQMLANLANLLSATYTYSPADGRPGYRLAAMVAENLKGKAVLPEVAPGPPGVIY